MSCHVVLFFFMGGVASHELAHRGHSDNVIYSMCGVNAVKGHNIQLYKHICFFNVNKVFFYI